jgi:predicted GNAT superfamily acetyltransferase
METITIRALSSLDELRASVELQKYYWGDDLESVVPTHMLFSLVNYGGHVLAAFDGNRMVGVLIGFLGTNIAESHRPAMANLLIASKRMVVLPEYRGQGIGYRLKLAQRDIAVKQGVRLVRWTFDPLLAANAHLNLRKLGGVSGKYRENYYGEDAHYAVLGSSDRLILDWWVTHRRVEERLNGTRGDLKLKQYLEAGTVIVNPTISAENGMPHPAELRVETSGSFALLEIPLEYPAMVERDEALAREWRRQTRELFQYLFQEGFIVTDFLRETYEGRDRAFYLFSFNMGFDFSLN